MMETTLPVVEITVKPEHMESENIEEDKQNGYNEHTQKANEEELWIKAEPLEDESQDFIKEDDLGTLSENEARLYEEALNDDCNRNRRSNVPSRKQILVFLDFLNKHRELANCMLRGPTGRHKAQQLWEDITERLNSISGSIKTTQQWQRVWSRQKYLTRKAAATRYACLSIGGLLAPELTPQHEKILTIIGEPIPPRGFCQKPGTPEVRGKPLSKEETKSLLGLIENSKVILSKTTNATNNKMKTEEWQRLANHFNATATVHRRTPQQLRLKWENLKKNARKRSTRIRMNRIQPKLQTLKHPQEFLVVSVPPKSGPVTIELEPQPVFPTERVIPQPELPRQPIIPPRKPYTPRKIESLRKEVSRKSDISQSEVQPTPVIPLDLSKPLDGSPKPVVQEQNEEPPSLSISDLSSPPYTQLEKETNDLKSTLPLKKRLEKRIKLEDDDDDFPKKEKPEEKNVTEDNAQQVDNSQPKMETPLMYSYDTLRNIEIVTIDEEERQKEYQETLKSRQHMRHVCVHCALGFVLKQAFDMHMKVHSPQSGDHECLLCHSRLKTADMLYRHRLRHYRRYRCLLCRTRFKDKDTAACHVMNDHAGQTFECDHCGRGFKRPQYLKRHVEQHHTKPHNLECGVCFRVFHERGWYRSHIRTHNEEVRAKTVRLPVTCEICSRDYKNKASLKRHLLTHDENVHCEICYEKCKNRITLGHHYLKVHNEKYVGAPEQTCPHCDRICATRAMLKRHMQRMHSDRTKKYQCDHCQRLYLTKGEVRAHITWSHMPAEARGGHACTCGRIFRSPSLLRDHKARFHASQPPPRVHQCEHCEKAFANKQVLNRHKKSHSNEMYPCKECGLLFKTQPYVKVHYQIKHLNMTRAQIKAQRKLNKEQLIQNNIHRSTNWEPPINNKKKSSVAMEKEEDPLLVQEGDIQIKLEKEEELQIPTFQTFVDITRE